MTELENFHQAVVEFKEVVDQLFPKDQTYICLTCKRETEGFGCQYCEDEDV